MYSFIDLFAGIGGFRSALEKKGLRCVFSSEIDKHAREAYEKNFGERPFGDITEISENDIPNHDILCAGFPCQAFSISGKHNAFDDNRGRLFYEIIRIAKEKKPLVMILENVKNILTIQKGYVFNTIGREIRNLGYNFFYSLFNCSDFGVPQKRERVYMVCIRKETTLNYKKPKPTYKQKFLRDMIMSNEFCKDLIINRDDIFIKNKDAKESLSPIRLGIVNKGGQGERIYSTNGHAITLSANGGGVGARTGLYLVDGKVRKLHIEECKSLMGFSKRHYVSNGMQGYKQLGNAVCVSMVGKVYDSIRAA